jgi:hypothetical protein
VSAAEFRSWGSAPQAAADAQEQTTGRFIQICASQNDLFALDEHGDIYRYNFSTKTWVTLNRDLDRATSVRRVSEDDGA